MLLPPATINARFKQFGGLKEGIGSEEVDVAISVIELDVPKMEILKFSGK